MTLKLAVYAVILVVAWCDQEQIPLVPLVWVGLMRTFYDIAEFCGRMGIRCETRYWESVNANG